MKENILWGVLPVQWDNYTKRQKINYPLMDQVKAYVTLTIKLISIIQSGLKCCSLRKIWIPPLAGNKVSKEIFARIPRGAMLVSTGHDLRWTKPGACGNVLTFCNKVTPAWQNRQETVFTRFSCKRLPVHDIFLQAIAGNNCSTMTLVSPGLQVLLCLCLQFSTGSNYISNEFESFAFWRFLRTCKRTRTFPFFLRRHGIDIPS